MVLGVYVWSRLSGLGAEMVTGDDEYFSVWAAHFGRADMLSAVVRDMVHPPLFYALLEIWIAIGGYATPWLRLLPALLAAAAPIPLLLLARELGIRPREVALALLLATVGLIPYHTAHFLRMYSLLELATLSTLWLFVRFLRSDPARSPSLGWLTLANLILVYTHYYGWLIVATEMLCVAVWRRDRWLRFAASCALLVLAAAPWFYEVARAALALEAAADKHLGWIARPHWHDVLDLYVPTPGGVRRRLLLAYLLVPLGALAWFAWSTARPAARARAGEVLWLAPFAVVPTALAVVASHVLPVSIWGHRYLSFAIWPFLLVLSVALCRLPGRSLRTFAIVCVVGWSAVTFQAGRSALAEPPWDLWVERMLARVPEFEEVPVYALSMEEALPIRFQLLRRDDARLRVQVVKGKGDPAGNLYHWAAERGIEVVEVRGLEDLPGGHFWLAYHAAAENPDNTAPAIHRQLAVSVPSYLASAGLQVGQGYEAGGTRLVPVWRPGNRRRP